MVAQAIPERAYAEQWDVAGLHTEVLNLLGLDLPIADWAKEEGIADEAIRERITKASDEKMATKDAAYGADTMRMVEKSLLLQLLDQTWKDHLLALDHLRQGINLRAYAQQDPLNEYKREAFELFSEMLTGLRATITRYLSNIELRVAEPLPQPQMPRTMVASHPAVEAGVMEGAGPGLAAPDRAAVGVTTLERDQRVSRNALCPCGSGKKYKHCHGRV
jgi:preprotein translocase subunit SecA